MESRKLGRKTSVSVRQISLLHLVLSLVGAFLSPLCLAAPPPGSGWEEISRFEQIVVYRKRVAGSQILAYRGEGIIRAPFGQVVTAIRDTPNKPNWIDRISSAEIVRVISPTERIEYMRAKIPWPVADRDFVYTTKVQTLPSEHQIRFELKSIEEPGRPEVKGVIRGIVHLTQFILTSLNGGQLTHIVAEAHGDPRGEIPPFLVNAIQKTFPPRSLRNLMRYLKDNTLVEDPLATLVK